MSVVLGKDSSGWRGTVTVPNHYGLDLPLRDVRVDSSGVGFVFPDALPPAAFTGRFEGEFIRGKFASPLGPDTLRGQFELRRRPHATIPYITEEVRFRNGDLVLAGTVFRPRGIGPHPAVVFVHGSGPQTRDSYLRWFADRFARAGFVTLIYDKRGTGASGGERWPLTSGAFSDLAADAVAGIRFLHALPHVHAGRIGLWGLSQGAWIAPMAAGAVPDMVNFLILLSGGGVSPAEQELYDDEVKLRDLGFGQDAVGNALDYLRLADQYVRTQSDEDWSHFARAREEARTQPWYSHLDRFPQVLPRDVPVWAGLRADLDYDPVPALSALRVPVLLVLGEEDRLTPAHATSDRVRRALEAGGNRRFTVRLLPSAGHALTVNAAPRLRWIADVPAGDWVSETVNWATRLR